MNLTAVLLILVIIVGVESSQRVKRRLAFIKGSKFFLRLNFKAQSFPTTILFAYAAGYKLNFELPDDANKAPFRFHRRAIYENVESALDQHGLDGRSCILKFLCEAEQVLISTNNLFQKTLKLIFTNPEHKLHTALPYQVPKECEKMADICPLSLLDLLSLQQISEV